MSNTRALFESIQTNLKENYSIDKIEYTTDIKSRS